MMRRFPVTVDCSEDLLETLVLDFKTDADNVSEESKWRRSWEAFERK
jgi:hypothetical protein